MISLYINLVNNNFKIFITFFYRNINKRNTKKYLFCGYYIKIMKKIKLCTTIVKKNN